MAIYLIGDLHLSLGSGEKPMDVFGSNWENHSKKIKENWLQQVKEEDTVILAGDFSWEMNLKDTYEDFSFIHGLPGKKILLKGNHDYWWTTITSMRNFLKQNKMDKIDFLYNNSYKIDNKIIVGTRGWNLNDIDDQKKMIIREARRLELSIEEGLSKKEEQEEMICIMHYPPITKNVMKNEYTYDSEFLDVMKKYSIKTCYYAHLHGASHNDAIEGEIEGIEFKLISADYLDFRLVEV